MLKDVLAKSDPRSRATSVLAVMDEDFGKALRTLHYPLTPEVSFTSVKDLRQKLEKTVQSMGQGSLRTLSVHGHGALYDGVPAIEMGNDYLHHTTIKHHRPDLEAIGKLFGKGGNVQFCSVLLAPVTR